LVSQKKNAKCLLKDVDCMPVLVVHQWYFFTVSHVPSIQGRRQLKIKEVIYSMLEGA